MEHFFFFFLQTEQLDRNFSFLGLSLCYRRRFIFPFIWGYSQKARRLRSNPVIIPYQCSGFCCSRYFVQDRGKRRVLIRDTNKEYFFGRQQEESTFRKNEKKWEPYKGLKRTKVERKVVKDKRTFSSTSSAVSRVGVLRRRTFRYPLDETPVVRSLTWKWRPETPKWIFSKLASVGLVVFMNHVKVGVTL